MAEEKKIIVDEDWKSQVQAEKAAASKGEPEAGAAAAGSAQPDTASDPEMPPASFDLLLTMLGTEALVAMGQVPHPVTGKPQVQRNQAKYLIDTIEMLREKTKGNLTPDEDQLAENLLHQLRMLFVETAGSVK